MVSRPADISFPVTRRCGMLTEGRQNAVGRKPASQRPAQLLICLVTLSHCSAPLWASVFPSVKYVLGGGGNRDRVGVGMCRLHVQLKATFLGAVPALLKFHWPLSCVDSSDFGHLSF